MRETKMTAYAATWLPLHEVWIRFCRDSQQLGISPTPKAMSNFLTVHRAKLLELGVIAKSNKQRLLGHRDLFASAAFALAIGHDPVSAIHQQRLALAERAARHPAASADTANHE